MIFAYDYETFYSKTYSIRDLGNWAYVNHPEFDAYMLSVVGEDGFEYVGPPGDFDWNILNGQTVVAHNAGFEAAITARLKELGIIPPDTEFAALYDTADLAAYLGWPRSLKEAAAGLLGVKVDKGMRDRAKGLRWADMTPDFQEAMKEYALEDSRLELRLWLEHNHKWPDYERELSQDTREMCAVGIPVDLPAIQKSIGDLQTLLAAVRARIPWTVKDGANDPEAKALSKKEVAIECAKHNVLPPKSMAKDSEEFDEWLRVHGADLPWARAMGQYRSINIFLKKLIAMATRTMPNGYMNYGLKYFGAHTGRDSGDGGMNPQNFAKAPMFETEFSDYLNLHDARIDIRGMMVAPEGKIFGVVDLSAIEPCVLAVFAEDWDLVEKLKQGMDIYEAWARLHKGYTDPRPLKEVDPVLRQLCKIEVLGLGYGAGVDKLISIAKRDYGVSLTADQGGKIVFGFRARKLIPNLWKKLERDMTSAAPGDYTIELPSGREMRYRTVKTYGGITAVIPYRGRMMRLKFWGGTLTENVVQAASRDVFITACLKLKQEELPPVLRVHDEAVSLLNESTAEADLARMEKIMSTPPEWMPDLPTSAAGHLCKKYRKG